jgi:hypothetical protein
MTHRFLFDGDKLSIDTQHNVRWGDTQRPRISSQP